VHLVGQDLESVRSISYSVGPKPGSVSKPVRVTYSMEALADRGRVMSGEVLLPVFGLYAGYANSVSIDLRFDDDSTQVIADTLTTAAYTDPNGVYDVPEIIKQRAPGSALDFDFFAMKSGLGTPVIVDTDGAIRWVGAIARSHISSVYTDNGFLAGSQSSGLIWRAELDGTETRWPSAPSIYRRFHHNMDVGKSGFLAGLNTATDFQSTIVEFTKDGGIHKVWDFATIVGDQLRSAGEDPSVLVRPPNDWFHTNSAIYDASDDSLIVSSREHGVMKIDYDTGEIRWILGDPTKYWHQFPSLRAKALTLDPGGLYPTGQHALSFTHDGLLLLFNAGNPSLAQPAGAPRGESRTYAAVSAYRIDGANMTATEVWRFDYGQLLKTDHCSSAYEAGQSILVSYARINDLFHARLVGLNRQHEVVFDFQYEARGCNTSWNAVPVPLEDMRFE
jgi:arylsulfate sulfotransferase